MRSVFWRSYLALGVVGLAICRLLPDGATRDAVFVALGICAVAAATTGLLFNRPYFTPPWYALLAGMTLLVAGGAAHSYQHTAPPAAAFDSSFASLAGDVASLSGYLAVAAALVLFIHQRARVGDAGPILDAAIGAAGVGMVSLVLLMEPFAGVPLARPVERLISTPYPLLGAFYLAAFTWLWLVSGTRPLLLYLFGAGLALLAICGTLQAAALLDGTYGTGSITDYGQVMAYTLWAAAALHPAMGGSVAARPRGGFQDRLTAHGFGLLAAAPLLGPTVFAFQYLRGEPANVYVVLGGSAALCFLSLARLRGLAGAAASAREQVHETIERERSHGAWAAALVAAADRRAIEDAVRVAARTLVENVSPAGGASVALGSARELASERRDGISFGDLPSAVRDALLRGRSISFGGSSRAGEDFYVPLLVGGRLGA